MAEAALADAWLAATAGSNRTAAIEPITRKLLDSDAGGEAGFTLARLLLELRTKVAPDFSARQPDTLYPVLDFLCRTIIASQDDMTKLRAVVRLCNRWHEVLENLMSACVVTVRGFATALDSETDEIPPAPLPCDMSAKTSEPLDDSFQRLSLHNCLQFVKVLLLQVPKYASEMAPQWMTLLATVLGHGSHEYSHSSKDVISLLLSYDTNSLHADSKRGEFWRRILDQCTPAAEPKSSSRPTNALLIWLRILSTEATTWLPSDAFDQDEYWLKIQTMLAVGSAEQRKVCLAILNRSIALCDRPLNLPLLEFCEAKAALYQSQYARFATFFETIVLTRYLNQIQDCLPDLITISKTPYVVRPSWIITLLHAGLGHGMQDSVRKLVGSWTLCHGATLVAQSKDTGALFFEQSFLPWVTLGSHFNSSVLKPLDAEPSCPFGERLSDFLKTTIELAPDDRTKLMIVEAILRFLAFKGGRIFSFARAFVLEGLASGVRRGKGMSLSEDGVSSLAQIAQEQSFPEAVRDLMVLQCFELYGALVPPHLQDADSLRSVNSSRNNVITQTTSVITILESTVSVVVSRNARNEDKCSSQTLFSMAFEETLADSALIRQLGSWIENSKRNILSGLGLKAASELVSDALENRRDDDIDPSDLNYVLAAIWSEAELREYPRAVLIDIPGIVFHPRCARLEADSDALRRIVETISNTLREMLKTRIYLLYPIVAALGGLCSSDSRCTVRPAVDILLDYVNSPPTSSPAFLLERVMSAKLAAREPSKSYKFYYGEFEELGHAGVISILNKLPPGLVWDQACRDILNKLIARWLKQRPPVPVFTSWKSTMQLQVILMFVERLAPNFSEQDIGEYLVKLLKILSIEPLPRMRFLLEWAILRVYLYRPGKRQELLSALSSADISNPKYTASLIKLAYQVARLPGSQEMFTLRVLAELVSFATCQKIAVRYEAQWTLPLLWDHAEEQGWKSVMENVAIARLNRQIRSLEAFKTPPAARILEQFDPVQDHTITNLFQGRYLMLDPSEMPNASCNDLQTIETHARTWRSDAGELMPLGQPHSVPSLTPEAKVQTSRVPAENPATMLQTKSSLWLDSDPTMRGVSAATMEAPGERRSTGVVVVASLIDSPYNLGGICRVSEIFGIETLKVKSSDVIKSKDFTSVSVASHLWLPIEELGTDGIADYLRQCRLEGYQLVGIEQTDNSRILGRDGCELPRKMVLVLGSEKEGIPADLLAELDFCVEIRQSGVTRSMNVQTALSVGLFEYQRQHQRR